MKQEELIAEVKFEWDRWEECVAMSGCRIAEAGVAGHWSVKDLIAHISWYEREMVELIETHILTGSPWWNKPLDERNDLIYQANKTRSLSVVWDEALSTHKRLMQALSTLDDAAMVTTQAFTNMPEEWVPWQIIAGNTFWHYRDHAEDVRRWLAK